jgi:tetratricopeptide (TPR) repeat protein
MKKAIILLSFIFTIIHLSAQTTVEQANAAYSDGDFPKAAQLYEEALRENGESADVYYNLGNAYYRLNRVAPSILNYERALLLQPGDGDIRFNLEIAKLKAVDKIEPVGEFFLTEAYNSVKNAGSTNQWSYLSIAFFILLVAGLFLYFFSRKIIWKKIGFYSGLAFLVLCFVTATFAYSQKNKLTHRNTAIIFSATTTIKSSPDNSGTDLFILHEGTKVDVKDQLNDWKKIETADGNVGWIKSNELEVI